MKRYFRDSRGRFRKHRFPPRDSQGRFRRDKRKRAPVEGPKRVSRRRQGKSRKPVQSAVKQGKVAQGEPRFNLCFAADREDFYQTIRLDIVEERHKLENRGKDLEASAVRVAIDVHGLPSAKRRTKKQRKSRRKSTAFIGERTFLDLRKLRKFLIHDAAYGRREQIDWSQRGMCQYPKTAMIFYKIEGRRMKRKVLKTYQLGA